MQAKISPGLLSNTHYRWNKQCSYFNLYDHLLTVGSGYCLFHYSSYIELKMCKSEFPCLKEVPTAVCTLDTYFGQIDWYTAHFYFHSFLAYSPP